MTGLEIEGDVTTRIYTNASSDLDFHPERWTHRAVCINFNRDSTIRLTIYTTDEWLSDVPVVDVMVPWT